MPARRYKHVRKATKSHVLEYVRAYYTWQLARARGRGRHMLWDTEGEAGSVRHAPGPDEIENHGCVQLQIPLEFEGCSIKNRRGGLGRRDSGLRRGGGSGGGGGHRKQPTGDVGHALGHPRGETLLTRRDVELEFSHRGCNAVELHLEVRHGSTIVVPCDENNTTRTTA